jgi:hypothetical protein
MVILMYRSNSGKVPEFRYGCTRRGWCIVGRPGGGRDTLRTGPDRTGPDRTGPDRRAGGQARSTKPVCVVIF